MKKLLLSLTLMGAAVAGAQAQTVINFNSALTNASPTFNRPEAGTPPTTLSATGTAVRYAEFTFTAPTTGVYRIASTGTFNNFGILYGVGGFSATSPLVNAITANDDAPGGGTNFGMQPTLAGGNTYTLVVTSNANGATGAFTVTITDPVALPVKLLSFTATESEGNRADLTWRTSAEEGMAYYEVEKSLDGKAFSAVSRVNASAKSNEGAYTATDAALQAGNNYYRLKMVGADGSTAFSGTQLLVGSARATAAITVSPNPAGSSATLVYNAAVAGTTAVMLADVQGRVVYNRNHEVSQGTNSLSLDLGDVAPGTYMLRWANGQEQGVVKMEKR